jgi:hypothetical protein
MKWLLFLLTLGILVIPGLTRVASIKSIRNRNRALSHEPRRLGAEDLETDLKISDKRSDLFTQYLRYHLTLTKEEQASKRLVRLVRQLNEEVESFGLQMNDHISVVLNSMQTQRLSHFIRTNPAGTGLD